MTNRGFTIVELLMAMAFFSFILMFAVAGFIQINRAYTRGVTVRRVQDGARSVIEEISRVIRTSSNVQINTDPAADHGAYRLCMGGVRFGWNQFREGGSGITDFSNETYNGDTINFIKSYDSQACSSTFDTVSADNVSSPLDRSVQIQHLGIKQIGNSVTTKTYQIKIVASSTENSDIDPATYGENARCLIRVGDQFCDIAELETVVSLRN